MHVEKFTGGPYATNGYVVSDKSEAAAIDVPAGTAKKILEYLKTNSLHLALVIATHVHWDHIEDAAKLCKAAGAEFAIHRTDEENQSEINSIFEGEAGLVRADKHLAENDKINAGGVALSVLHTPGHTPGSICLYAKKEKILFSGDTLFKGSYGRIDFPLSNQEDMTKSLHRLAKLPFDTSVYPGHGLHTTIGSEKWMKDV